VRQSERQSILRWEEGLAPREAPDELAVEEPLEIRLLGRSVMVTMRTPGHDQELAAGFLLSEGVIRDRAELRRIRPVLRKSACNVINVGLAPRVAVDLASLSRHVFASSSCGLCGKATIEAVHGKFPPLEAGFEVPAGLLASLPQRLLDSQRVFERTGGLHAAVVFDAEGEIVVAREDVGRHNAVDKVLGHALLGGLLPLERHVLMVSGRASFEIVQKALSARIPVVAAVSAPSSLAVEFAHESSQTLVGFLRNGRMNVYSQPERIRFPAARKATVELLRA